MASHGEGDASNTNDAEERVFDLHRIPSEIRNKIYELLVIEDEPVDIKSKRPPVTQVCKQARKESLPMYFGCNNFATAVIDTDYQHLLVWMKTLLPENVTILRRLSIMCCGQILMDDCGVFEHRENFSHWYSLIAALSNSGFSASQLVWPALSEPLLHIDLEYYSDEVDMCINKYRFSKYTLTPLLRHFRLLDPKRLPADAIRQFAQEYESFGYEYEDIQYDLDWMESEKEIDDSDIQSGEPFSVWWSEYCANQFIERAHLEEKLNDVKMDIEKLVAKSFVQLSGQGKLLEGVTARIKEARGKAVSRWTCLEVDREQNERRRIDLALKDKTILGDVADMIEKTTKSSESEAEASLNPQAEVFLPTSTHQHSFGLVVIQPASQRACSIRPTM